MVQYGKFDTPEKLLEAYTNLEQAYGKQGSDIGRIKQDLAAANEFIREFQDAGAGGQSGQYADPYAGGAGAALPDVLQKFAKDPEKFLSNLLPKLIHSNLFGEGFDFGQKEGEDGVFKAKNLADLIYEMKGGINLLHIGRTIPEIYDEKFGERVKKTIEEAKKRGDTLSIVSAAMQAKKEIEAERLTAAKKTKQVATGEQRKEEVTSSQPGEGGTVETSVETTETTGEKTPEEDIKDSIVTASKEETDEL